MHLVALANVTLLSSMFFSYSSVKIIIQMAAVLTLRSHVFSISFTSQRRTLDSDTQDALRNLYNNKAVKEESVRRDGRPRQIHKAKGSQESGSVTFLRPVNGYVIICTS